MTKREDESDRRNPEWMWVTVSGTRNPFPGRKQQHEPVYGSIGCVHKQLRGRVIYLAHF